jgi:hypothetical protein
MARMREASRCLLCHGPVPAGRALCDACRYPGPAPPGVKLARQSTGTGRAKLYETMSHLRNEVSHGRAIRRDAIEPGHD